MSDFDDWNGELGYGKPPPWGRFKKGRSGNPKGRPKKAKRRAYPVAGAADRAIDEELSRKYKINENGKAVQATGLQAVARSQVQSALKGNSLAQREVLRNARERDERLAREAEAELRERTQLFEHIVNWRADRTREWAEAEQHGAEPAAPWPHPDDILLRPETLDFKIRGPSKVQDVGLFEFYRSERDVAFLRALRDRCFEKARSQAGLSIWDPIWMAFDALLPKRWQIKDITMVTMALVDTLTRAEMDAAIDRYAQRAANLSSLYAPHRYDRQANALAGKILKPVAHAMGYRSLAHFEAVQTDQFR